MTPITLTSLSGHPCTVYAEQIFALKPARSQSTVIVATGGAEIQVQESPKKIEADLRRATKKGVEKWWIKDELVRNYLASDSTPRRTVPLWSPWSPPPE